LLGFLHIKEVGLAGDQIFLETTEVILICSHLILFVLAEFRENKGRIPGLGVLTAIAHCEARVWLHL
jgi:hypothetical protein